MIRLLFMISFAGICQAAIAQDEIDPDKKRYTLFRAVPKDKMREMHTDRPDVTESAYSVDAGHFQYETDIYKLVRNKHNGVLSIRKIYNHANLKLGITNTTDVQVVIESLVENTDIASGSSTGFGEIALRVKQNLWGNDRGKTAFAMMPYIAFPTSGLSESKVIQGGIVFPLAIQINNWDLGTQAGLDILKNTGDTKYNAEILYSFTASTQLASKLDAFGESSSTYNFKSKDTLVSVNSGIGFSITDNFKVDAGISYGITKATDRVYFAGLSFRY